MQPRRGLVNLCERAMLPLLCLLMADCCLFGAGRVLSAGPLGFRMIVLALFMAVSCPAIVRNWKALLRNRAVILLLAFCGWLCVSTVLGVRNGHRMSLIVTDWKGFIYFATIPAVLVTLSDRARIRILQRVMMVASAALAVGEAALLGLYLYAPQAYVHVAEWANARQIAMMGTITQSIPRLFMKSSMYLVCGCAFAICFQAEEEKLRARYVLIASVCLFALLLTYTRSIYLGAAITAAGMLCLILVRLRGAARRRTLGLVGLSVAGFLCLTLAFDAAGQTGYLKYAFSRMAVTFEQPEEAIQGSGEGETPSAENGEAEQEPGEGETPSATTESEEQAQYNELTMDSDVLRAETLRELLQNIGQSPLVGLGLGAEIAVRPDGLNEYFYLDLMSKAGLVGLALYLLPAVGLAFSLFRGRKRSDALLCGSWFSILLGFLAFSFFNPYMNASLGILMYCCCLAVFPCTPGRNGGAQTDAREA